MPKSSVADTTRRWRVTPLHVGFNYFDRWGVVDKFGKNPDIDTVFEDVWSGGGTITFLTSAETLDVVSDNILDDAGNPAGNAHTVRLEGLDNSYNEITEDINLDGTTPVTTTKSFLRFNRCLVIAVGTAVESTNVGTITITASTAGTIQSVILPEEGQSQQAIFTIPLGKTGFFESAFMSVDTMNVITAQLRVRPFNQGWQLKHEVKLPGGHTVFDMSGSGELPEKTDITWRAVANNPNNVVVAGFKILLYTE